MLHPMISDAEKRFREAERKLDELLQRDEAIIAAGGISITDESARAYHYKNDYLSWRYSFEARRARESEVERVWVVLSVHEDDEEALRIWRRAEIFQTSKLSRWESTIEEVRPIKEAMRDGLASIVLEAIRGGWLAVAEVV